MGTPLIVNLDDVEDADDPYGDALYQGKLFSGIAFEMDPVTRSLRSLSGYDCGKYSGPSREWYPNGQIAVEDYYKYGGHHGPQREWYPDGRLRRAAYVDCGVLVWRKVWDESGTLLEERDTRPGTPLHDRLLAAREKEGGPVIDIDVHDWRFIERPEGWMPDDMLPLRPRLGGS